MTELARMLHKTAVRERAAKRAKERSRRNVVEPRKHGRPRGR